MIQPVEHWRTLDSEGKVMPWYSRPLLEVIEPMDLNGKRVFEYGSGQSSLWWRSRGCIVEGVDDQEEWAMLAGVRYIDNQQGYLKCIFDYEPFDIVCIDGVHRDQCLDFAIQNLKEDGMILIDNWKQASAGWGEWPITEQTVKTLGLKLKEYHEPTHPDWVSVIITR